MTIRNLTPHAVTLRSAAGDTVLPPDGLVVRVASTPGADADVPGLPVPVRGAPTWGAVEGLPAPQAGVVLIVSGLVLARISGRGDVVAPGTGPADGAVRDSDGRIVAVTRLIAPLRVQLLAADPDAPVARRRGP